MSCTVRRLESARAPLCLILALLAAATLLAQPQSEARATAGEVTLTGNIRQVVKHSVDGLPEIHLIIAAGERDLEVHVAPAYYLQWHQCQLHAGERVEITVRKTSGEPHYLARGIRCGVRSLTLRDQDYRPLWKKGQK